MGPNTSGVTVKKWQKMFGKHNTHCSRMRGKPVADNEVQTAESSESVTNASGATTQSKAETARQRAAASVQPPVQGHGQTNWDGEVLPPDQRLSVAEDPTGEKNAKAHEKYAASQKKSKK